MTTRPTPTPEPARRGRRATSKPRGPVGQVFAGLRGEQTVAAIARVVGVAEGTWRGWETGHREPSVDDLLAAAVALGVEPVSLGQLVAQAAAQMPRRRAARR